MKSGDTVKFTNETKEEKESRENGNITMRIVWIDEPRAMIESVIDGMSINPTAIYNTSDIEQI